MRSGLDEDRPSFVCRGYVVGGSGVRGFFSEFRFKVRSGTNEGGLLDPDVAVDHKCESYRGLSHGNGGGGSFERGWGGWVQTLPVVNPLPLPGGPGETSHTSAHARETPSVSRRGQQGHRECLVAGCLGEGWVVVADVVPGVVSSVLLIACSTTGSWYAREVRAS